MFSPAQIDNLGAGGVAMLLLYNVLICKLLFSTAATGLFVLLLVAYSYHCCWFVSIVVGNDPLSRTYARFDPSL